MANRPLPKSPGLADEKPPPQLSGEQQHPTFPFLGLDIGVTSLGGIWICRSTLKTSASTHSGVNALKVPEFCLENMVKDRPTR